MITRHPLVNLALAVAVLAAGATPPAAATVITILHVNDSHSHLEAVGPRTADLKGTLGGMEKAATVIAAQRASEPNVLLLHAGDVFHGDLFFNVYFGVPELQLMQQLGFDAMAVGNHEFDLGPEVLAYSLDAAYGPTTLPLLSANLDLSGYPDLQTWIKPSTLKEVGGVRVGIFGMTVPTDPFARPDPVRILGGDDPAVLMGIAAAQVEELRAAGAEVVICLSHLGLLYDRALAENVPGIDVIVGGHNHFKLAQPESVTNPVGSPTLIVQAGCNYEYVGRLRVAVEDGAVDLVDYSLLPVDASVTPDPTVTEVVEALKPEIVGRYGPVFTTPIAHANWDLTTTWDPGQPMRDTAMGNLITDAMRARTGTDLAITANGLISEGIARGPVVAADLFRPVSYGYDPETGLGLKLATFSITGAELVKGIESGLAMLGVDEDFFLQVSGMTFNYDAEAPIGQRVLLRSARIGGQALDPAASYTVTVNEGIASLLPLMGVQVSMLQILPDLEYTVLFDFVQELELLQYRPIGRIRDVSVHQPDLALSDDSYPKALGPSGPVEDYAQ